jgi:microfibrillar-associated protein 1
LYQTTNPIIAPKEETILSVARLERAVLTVEAKEALKGLCRERDKRWWQFAEQAGSVLGPLQGGERGKGPGIWICGSFACGGIPLLEGCVVSARNIVEQGVWKNEGLRVMSPPW